MVLSEQPSPFESPSKDISELVSLHKSKEVIHNMFGKYMNISLWEGGVRFLPVMNYGASATPAPHEEQ